jgi:hypothetical protein
MHNTKADVLCIEKPQKETKLLWGHLGLNSEGHLGQRTADRSVTMRCGSKFSVSVSENLF